MIAHRKSKGSMVFLVSLIIGIILVVGLCGVGFNYLLFMRARAQYAADAMALSLASKINLADRIGELNELEEASRELVFVSRQDCDQSADTGMPDLTGLCDQLLEDARSNHSLVEKERQNQILSIKKEVQQAIIASNQARKKSNNLAFFGLQIFEPEIEHVDLGRIAKVNSNVRVREAIPDLTVFDFRQSYFDKRTKLYACDLNARLPEPDLDLDFNFSSLPAYMGNMDAPARNTNAKVFVPYGTIFADGKIKDPSLKQIPSAIQIYYSMNVIAPWDPSKIVPIQLLATGSASGASLDSQ